MTHREAVEAHVQGTPNKPKRDKLLVPYHCLLKKRCLRHCQHTHLAPGQRFARLFLWHSLQFGPFGFAMVDVFQNFVVLQQQQQHQQQQHTHTRYCQLTAGM